MKRTTEQRLRDALTAAELVAEAVAEHTFADYLADVWLRSGVERQLEIVGEALNSVRRMSPDVAARIPRVNEWIALLHIIAHLYDDVDHQIVWDAACGDIPELRGRLETILGDAADDRAT